MKIKDKAAHWVIKLNNGDWLENRVCNFVRWDDWCGKFGHRVVKEKIINRRFLFWTWTETEREEDMLVIYIVPKKDKLFVEWSLQ